MAAAPLNPTGAPQPTPLPQSRSRWAQVALAGLIVLAIGLLGRSVLSNASWHARPTELADEQGPMHRLDLNHASKAELLQVTGLGEKTVERILDYRSRQRFHSVEDLTKVGGIREATLDKLRRYFYVDVEDDDDVATTPSAGSATEIAQPLVARSSSSKKSSGKAGKKSALTAIVDINTADDKELQTLDGIGPAHAAEILRERAKAPFKSVDELTRVKGIKQATLEKIRARLTASDPPTVKAD
jgi:competence ComEA-like helix-hairpin-helix protein